MSIWKRLKNLWRWSALDPRDWGIYESEKHSPRIISKHRATVVDLKDPLDIDLGNNDDKK